jgi:formylglycine-generating enzyme required for sulfatase activity
MLRAIVALMIAALLSSAAHAEKRIALLIGNQSYSSEIGKLANPHNDIALLEKALKGLQFEVTSVRDAGLATLHQAVNAYARRVRAAGPNAVAFLYYAGHGAADAGTNYLIPVDVKSAEEGDLWDVSLRLTEITGKLKKEAGNATHFVVFDACRNNLKLRKAGSRALIESRGFVPVSQESGMLVAYATAEGELASDVGAGAGPYSSVLAEEIVKPGVEAVTMFRNVQRRVRAAIKQEPYLGFNALGDVYLAGLAPDAPKSAAAPAPAPPPAPTRLSEAAEAWASVKDSTDVRDLEAYRRQYGQLNPFYDRQAERRIEELKKQTAAAAPPPPPKPALAPLVETVVGLLSPSRAPTSLTAAEERALKPKDSFKECDNCPEMVVVPAGSFAMGSNPAEITALEKQDTGSYRHEGPQHKVTIARPFAVGKFAVTFDEWEACVGAGGCNGYRPGDQGWGRGRRPVINMSWDDAKAYVAWISKATGKSYRLLSEAEREYVARAGTTTPFWWGSSISTSQANYSGGATYGGGSKGEYRQKTVPVDSFAANPWGLYQVHGNLWEWVEDCWHVNYQGAPTDGSAWTTSCRESGRRVVRGGSWLYDPQFLRSASRTGTTSVDRDFSLGFRVGRTLTP